MFDRELPQCVFARNAGASPEGQLDDDTIKLAQEPPIPRAIAPAVEDEEPASAEKGATPPLFMFSQQPTRERPRRARLLSRKRARDGEPKGAGKRANPALAKRARTGGSSEEKQQQPEKEGGASSPAAQHAKEIE